MKILHVSSSRTFGGGERHMADLCRGLQARGHEIFVALRPTNEWQHRLDFLPAESILHVSIRNSFGVLSSMRIADFIRHNNIDIIHAHVARDYIPASIACMAAKPAKFVITRHVLFPLKPFNRYALKNLSSAIAVSDAVAESLRKVFPPRKVSVIKNGLDVSSLSTANPPELRKEFREFHSIATDVKVVGTLGELKELKGQRDFVLAANEIAKTDKKCRFVVVGKDNSGDQRFRRDLKRMVRVFGLEGRFTWLDWLNDTDAFFSAIDIFVSPSHSESFGLAMLEAMAHSKAIVATATEGAKELFGADAKLVRINDPVELSREIVSLLQDDELTMQAGELNKQKAQGSFPLDRMIQQTEELYLGLVDKKDKAAGNSE